MEIRFDPMWRFTLYVEAVDLHPFSAPVGGLGGESQKSSFASPAMKTKSRSNQKPLASGAFSCFLAAAAISLWAIPGTAAADLYVSTAQSDDNNTVIKLNIAGTGDGVAASFGSDVPQGMAFDSAGNLYVAVFGVGSDASTVMKYTPAGVSSAFVASLPGTPSDLVFDKQGNLYVGIAGNNTIEKYTPAGVGSLFATTSYGAPQGMAFDSAGNLYVTEYSSSGVNLIGGGGGTIGTTVTGSLSGSFTLATGASGETSPVTITLTTGIDSLGTAISLRCLWSGTLLTGIPPIGTLTSGTLTAAITGTLATGSGSSAFAIGSGTLATGTGSITITSGTIVEALSGSSMTGTLTAAALSTPSVAFAAASVAVSGTAANSSGASLSGGSTNSSSSITIATNNNNNNNGGGT